MALQAAFGHVDLMLRAAQPQEEKRASNLWGQVSRLRGWDKGVSCPEGWLTHFYLIRKCPDTKNL